MDTPPEVDATITDNDIVFECPYCGKSMAIDKRGMGLTIECPDCKGLVRVPTVSDSRARAPDSIHMPVEGLANALEEARRQTAELLVEVENLREQREELEKRVQARENLLQGVRKEFGNLQSALDRLSLVLAEGEEGA